MRDFSIIKRFKIINRKYIIQIFIFVILAISIQSPSLSQTSDLDAKTGIQLQRSSDTGLRYIFDIGLKNDRLILDSDQLPLKRIKGDRISSLLFSSKCDDFYKYQRCTLFLVIDGNQEVWWIQKNKSEDNWFIKQLPNINYKEENFFNQFKSSLNTNAPPSYLSYHSNNKIIYLNIGFIGSHSNFKNDIILTKAIKSDEISIVRPVYNSTQISGIFLIAKRRSFGAPKNAYAMEIVTPEKGFKRINLPSDCIVLGAINNSVLCGSRIGQISKSEFVIDGVKFAYVQAPKNGNLQTINYSEGQQPFHELNGSVVMTAYIEGVARPIVWNPQTGRSRWLINAVTTDCLSNVNTQILGITSDRKAALIKSYGLLKPDEVAIYPLKDGEIDICGNDQRILSKKEYVASDQNYKIERQALPVSIADRSTLGASQVPPFALIKSKGVGPLKGKLLLYSYGVFGAPTVEEYIGSWGRHWIDKGGALAVAHLPGGGGYGADWRIAGEGIDGKFYAASALESLVQYFRKELDIGTNGITLLSDSAGGPAQAYLAAQTPKDYDALVLRAACSDIGANSDYACTEDVLSFGDPTKTKQRERIEEFSSLDRLKSDPDAPLIIFGIPERDDRLDRDYQLKIANSIKADRRKIIHLPGVNHTDRLDDAGEERWVKAVVDAVIAESKRKAAGRSP